jgi:DNA phosphorothioation-associated putative methyltransferase
LQKMNIDAIGWDPHFLSENSLRNSDIVNLGFILNIIEDLDERIETLRKAYELADKLLVVSVMTEHQENYTDARLYRDGFLTNRNTFQKYFTQEEIKMFIEEHLSADAMAISLGIYYIFKSESLKQDFIANSVKRKIDWRSLSDRKHKEKQYAPRLNKYEKNQSLFDSFWHTCLEMGRLPRKDEFEFYDKVRRVAGSLPKGLQILAEQYDMTALEDARQKRIEDLEVYFCMSKFSQRIPFKNLSPSLQYDIKSFFGNYTDLEDNAMKLLISAGNPEKIIEECKKIKFGRNEKETFQFHSSYINELSVVLRIYVQCGSILYGNVSECDIIKIHKETGKLSVMFYDDFWKKAHPELKLRVKLKLRGQDVDVFDYATQDQIQLLYEKDSYLASSHSEYPKFVKLTDKEIENGLLSFAGYGPTKDEWEFQLEQKNLKIRGHQLLKRKDGK